MYFGFAIPPLAKSVGSGSDRSVRGTRLRSVWAEDACSTHARWSYWKSDTRLGCAFAWRYRHGARSARLAGEICAQTGYSDRLQDSRFKIPMHFGFAISHLAKSPRRVRKRVARSASCGKTPGNKDASSPRRGRQNASLGVGRDWTIVCWSRSRPFRPQRGLVEFKNPNAICDRVAKKCAAFTSQLPFWREIRSIPPISALSKSLFS